MNATNSIRVYEEDAKSTGEGTLAIYEGEEAIWAAHGVLGRLMGPEVVCAHNAGTSARRRLSAPHNERQGNGVRVA